MKTKTVTVKLDPSTHRWLNALAKANSHTELNAGTVTPPGEASSASRLLQLRQHAKGLSQWEARRNGRIQ